MSLLTLRHSDFLDSLASVFAQLLDCPDEEVPGLTGEVGMSVLTECAIDAESGFTSVDTSVLVILFLTLVTEVTALGSDAIDALRLLQILVGFFFDASSFNGFLSSPVSTSLNMTERLLDTHGVIFKSQASDES